MYGLPQAGQISHDYLVQHLEPCGYRPSNKTSGLRTHNSLPIHFTLVVGDFGVKYSGKEHALHLKTALEDKYKVTRGKLYIGIALKWDYEKSRSNYPYQDMYVYHSIHSNTRNKKYHKIHHTPVPNLYMERINRCYQRKN